MPNKALHGDAVNRARECWRYISKVCKNSFGVNMLMFPFGKSFLLCVIKQSIFLFTAMKYLNATILLVFSIFLTVNVGICNNEIKGLSRNKISAQLTNHSNESGKEQIASITTLKKYGGRVDWSHFGSDLIAFDRRGKDGYYDVYIMNSNGMNEYCLTCTHPNLPHRNMGQPAWHPSGNFIVFQVEKEKHKKVNSIKTNPGSGHYNDLWIMTADGKHVYQLTNIPNEGNYGILHPHFSHDGRKLAWSEMYQKPSLFVNDRMFGYWKLKIADFVFQDGIPQLKNICEYQPGDPGFYENHGFSPDDTKLIFSSNFRKGTPVVDRNDIFTMELREPTNISQLTYDAYNEHAIYSPNGRQIIWMSTKNNQNGGTDYWIMEANGTKKRRLTFFNDPGNPHYKGKKITVGDFSWSPDGEGIVAYYHDMKNIIQGLSNKFEEKILLIRLNLN